MEYLAGIGALTFVMLLALVICITLSPLIIWRNTNRANRLLEQLLNEAQRTNKDFASLEQPQPHGDKTTTPRL